MDNVNIAFTREEIECLSELLTLSIEDDMEIDEVLMGLIDKVGKVQQAMMEEEDTVEVEEEEDDEED